ncbi:CaiB/BaiF CoA transferase family protein [Anianabacter salinae]|uniref:CaiB/BaiF CoA transferase family protein n=1 Tax=Anianabacter salinae TaxID=2851023 RepID=UPI00225E3324|nr:CaiB/BaiF CoA-transferase family protein [Anianabacter salinae]MBV0911111.1 CoA transferase [Anianabacter salinae]
MLQGIRIVEIEGLGPGPFAGMLLADLGAEVIVVHRKGKTAPPGLLDRGKRSIALNLKDDADRAVLMRLIETADGLIEGFRPGVMERLGLGPTEVQAVNPRLVYGRMTGWGQDGPRATEAGHDLNYISLAGALWYASLHGDAPVTPPTLVGDIGGGALYLVIGLLSGILRARVSGQGAVVDAAIVDGAAHMMALLMSLAPSGAPLAARGESLLDGPHWSRSYQCADGGHVSVQCLEPQFHAEFLTLMGLSDDPLFGPQHDQTRWPEQTARLAEMFAEHPRDHWADLFSGSDACVAPILSPEEALRDPHMQARGVWRQDGWLQPAPAPRFDGSPPRTPAPPPERDADGAAIRAELGV